MNRIARLSFAATIATAVFALGASSAAFAQAKQQPAPPKAAAKEAPPVPQPLKQVALTDKQVEQLVAAQTEMDAITDKLPEGAADKPDPKLQAQMDAIVKKNGFADFNDYGAVYDNVALVMSGIDPKTKAFTEPPEMLKKQMAAVQADAKIPAKDKKAILDEMNAAAKTIAKVEFPANVTLVTKYFDKLAPLFQEE